MRIMVTVFEQSTFIMHKDDECVQGPFFESLFGVLSTWDF